MTAKDLVNGGAYLLHQFTNSIGQDISLFECPIYGEESPILLRFDGSGNCYHTAHFHIMDFIGDYEPFEIEGKMRLNWELQDELLKQRREYHNELKNKLNK